MDCGPIRSQCRRGRGDSDAVSVGGGKSGGGNNPKAVGSDGLVEVRW
jgi:hypothetical protein